MTDADEGLFEHAEAVRKKAYAPYSKFYVGAAIADENGKIHVGCNVENASYPLGACAETCAIGAMVSQGGTAIRKMAIVGGGDTIENCTPCGGCRQAISEFSDEDTVILLKDGNGAVHRYTVAEVLPLAFQMAPKK